MFVKRFHIGHVLAMTLMAAAVAAALVLVARPARQATDSASLGLSGSVAAVVDVGVTATAAATTLDLSINHTETALKVADITEMSNVPAGYTVTVSSANLAAGGRCGGAAGQACIYNAAGNEDVAITLLKGGTSLTFTGSTAQWSDTTAVQLAPLASAANVGYAVGAQILPQGTYTETLTFTITSK